jgi:hypothetical protein
MVIVRVPKDYVEHAKGSCKRYLDYTNGECPDYMLDTLKRCIESDDLNGQVHGYLESIAGPNFVSEEGQLPSFLIPFEHIHSFHVSGKIQFDNGKFYSFYDFIATDYKFESDGIRIYKNGTLRWGVGFAYQHPFLKWKRIVDGDHKLYRENSLYVEFGDAERDRIVNGDQRHLWDSMECKKAIGIAKAKAKAKAARKKMKHTA